MTGVNSVAQSVDFTVSNAGTLFAQANDAVIPTLAGPINQLWSTLVVIFRLGPALLFWAQGFPRH